MLLSLESVIAAVAEHIERELGRPTIAIEADTKLLQNGLIDSFQIVQLAEDVSATFGVDPAYGDLVPDDFRTPRILWTRLKEKVGGDEEESGVAHPPPLVRTSLRSGGQYTYWQDIVASWERKRAASSTWWHNMRVHLVGTLDTSVLERAIRRVLQRQESLRQLFDADPEARPGLCRAEAVSVTTVDMRGRPAEELDTLCRVEAGRPASICDGPLIRFFIVSRADDDHTLFVSYHQLVHDATRREMLCAEIIESYAALVEQRAEVLPSLPVRYVDHAAWERAWFAGGGRAAVEEAKKELLGAEPLRLPTDKPGAEPPGPSVVTANFGLSAEDSDRFSTMCRAGTLFSGIVAGVAIFLGRVCGGQEDITFLAPTDTRWGRDVQSLMGRFGNWSPIRVALNGDPTIGELIARSRAPHGALSPPAALVFETPDLFDHPLCRVALNIPELARGAEEPPLGNPPSGLTVALEPPLFQVGARNDLAFVLKVDAGRIVGQLRGAENRFEVATLERWAREFSHLLTTLRAELRVSQLG
jgi:acyl carrier protein